MAEPSGMDRGAVSRLTAQYMSAFVSGMTTRHTRFPPVDDSDIDKALDIAARTLSRFEERYPADGSVGLGRLEGYARTRGERREMEYRMEHPPDEAEEEPRQPLTEDAAVRAEARRLAQAEGRDPDEVPSGGSHEGVPVPHPLPPGTRSTEESEVAGRAERGEPASGSESERSREGEGDEDKPETQPGESSEGNRPSSRKRIP
jgi:hypothetical protein